MLHCEERVSLRGTMSIGQMLASWPTAWVLRTCRLWGVSDEFRGEHVGVPAGSAYFPCKTGGMGFPRWRGL